MPCLWLLLLAAPVFGAVSFNRDIRPIMSDTCFRCHGPDRGSRMAGLRLDQRAQAIRTTRSGITPIVPGDPAKSAIIDRIFSTSPARVMPPKYAHKELTTAQKETIRKWVAEGAVYEGHWAYEPVRKPELPKAVDGKMARNAVDAFIQSRLDREGWKPSPEADRRTLIRRVTLDLTGLPPSPEEVEAFRKDTSTNAYEKLVDRLMSSPQYAEMQALHWLDAVRYADTCGFHGDNPFPIWPYRDYVLNAFRSNKPFDVFTREQLAGDLLPDATVEQKVASAYDRLNRTSAEGGIQPREYLAKYGADRVRTLASVWLGSTMGCSECHDHKFDPFTSRDFYSMKAFFADIEETGLVPDRGPKAWGTQLELPVGDQKTRLEELTVRVASARREIEEKAEAMTERRAAWEKETLARAESGELAWRYQRPVSAESEHGAKLTVFNDEPVEMGEDHTPGDGLIVASGPNPDNETYTVKLKPGEGMWAALAAEAVQDESLPGIRVARGSDRLVVTEVEAEADGTKIPLVQATANFSGISPAYPAMAAIDGDAKTGWGVATYGENRNLVLALRFARPVHTGAGSTVTVRIRHDSEFRRAAIGRLRVALSSSGDSWPEPKEAKKGHKPAGVPENVLEALRKPEAERTEEQKKAVLAHFIWMAPELARESREVTRLEAEKGMLDASIVRVVVTESTCPRETRILARGNWMDESGAVVDPAIPSFLGKLETGGRRATRLDLANWLVSKDNPLTARAYVNRQWRLFFGTGLSKVLDDLGSQGEWPAHPELLDWLAADFMDGWDMKKLVRTIVTSYTYRQSSLSTPQLEERDPENRLLARQNRYRVDAEVVHDAALSISGLLTEKFGGPSVRPYQPDGYLAALNFPKRDYSASRGEDLYRRGIYTIWQRTFLHPMMMTFDAPAREECTINRTNSNTPLQALDLLNDPIFVEAARVFAQNILKQGGRGLARQMDWAFERALNRKPTLEERRVLLDLHAKSLTRFQANPAGAREFVAIGDAPVAKDLPAAKLAAMTAVARAILNLHETITRN